MHKHAKSNPTGGDPNKVPVDVGQAPPAPEPELTPPPPATEAKPDELEALKARAAKADEYWDRLLRLSADFDNYKKRAARERTQAVLFANEGLVTKLLPVLDTFEMALAAAGSEPAGNQLQAGIAMIANQLKAGLTEGGLEEVEAEGKKFDPNFHEAVAQEETSDVPEGNVVRQIRKGYKFRGRLIRAAGVIVAKQPAA